MADHGNESATGLPECETPVGHKWRVVNVDVQGYGSLGNYLYEACDKCGIVRVRREPEVYVETRDGGYERKTVAGLKL